jgi:crotonobetainyl-CoA:carnitine CoA-transferase CaiB-like acyl-CoA transferase
MCAVLGTNWADDPAYATNPARVAAREVLVPLITDVMIRRTKADLLAALEAANVPAGPINALDEVFADPQILHRRMVMDVPEPEAQGGTVPTLRTPIVIDGEAQVAPTAPPRLGQHSAEVLSDPAWGFGQG